MTMSGLRAAAFSFWDHLDDGYSSGITGSSFHQPALDGIMSLSNCDAVSMTVVDHMRERLGLISASATFLIRLRQPPKCAVEGQNIETGAMDEAPVAEAGITTAPEKVIGDRVLFGHFQHFPLIPLFQEVSHIFGKLFAAQHVGDLMPPGW